MEIYIYIDNVRVSYDYLRQFEYISAFCDEYSTRNPIFSSFFYFFLTSFTEIFLNTKTPFINDFKIDSIFLPRSELTIILFFVVHRAST